MTTIFSGKVPPEAARSSANQPPVHRDVRADKRFAGMLGHADPATPPTFRRAPGEVGEAISFAAMPLVAPAALPAVKAGDLGEVENRATETAANMPADASHPQLREEGASNRSSCQSGMEPNPTTAPVSARASSGPAKSAVAASMTAGEANEPAANPSPDRLRVAGSQAPTTGTKVRSAPVKAPVAAPPSMLDLGSGITVHLAGDADHPLVRVRGVRVGIDGGGEIKARIVKLMRSHGMKISEQAILFDGEKSI